MKTSLFSAATAAMLTAALALSTATGYAQDFAEETVVTPPATPSATSDESWYRPAAENDDKMSLAKEKAIARGHQRMARLESMRWYGFSGSRPTAAAIPYTTMYSPAWQQPGGRPFAWYTSSRPIIIYGSAATYR